MLLSIWPSYINPQGAYRTLKEVFIFDDLRGPFMCIFHDFFGKIYVYYLHDFPGLFNWVDIKQIRFLYTFPNCGNGSGGDLKLRQWIQAEPADRCVLVYMGQKCGNQMQVEPGGARLTCVLVYMAKNVATIWLMLYDFPQPRLPG